MSTQVVILAAGQGKRMKSDLPKPLLPLLGKPIIEWILDSVADVEELADPVVVVGHGEEAMRAALKDRSLTFVTQTEQLGTGHALMQCLDHLGTHERVLVLSGDVPLVSSETLRTLVNTATDAVVAGFDVEDPTGYGRLVCDASGGLQGIVEERDADDVTRQITLVNAGIYVFPSAGLADRLKSLTADNAQNEYYITDIPTIVAREGGSVVVAEIVDPAEVAGINDPMQLAMLVEDARARILEHHLLNGVFIDDPSSTWIEPDVVIAPGARVLPHCVIRRGVEIGARCEVGPFSHLREGTVLEEGAHVGNFMETKNAVLGPDVRAKHLSYIGDATLGAKVNVGAGTVFANYDGTHKHKTTVGDNVFIGSGTVLVAPVTLGEGASTGAGAIVTANHNVGAGETVIGVPARPIKSSKGKSS